MRRQGSEKFHYFTLMREVIAVASIASKLLEGGVGYLRVKTFQTGTHAEFVDAVIKLKAKSGGDLEGVILDLRNNPGGLVNEASALADECLGGRRDLHDAASRQGDRRGARNARREPPARSDGRARQRIQRQRRGARRRRASGQQTGALSWACRRSARVRCKPSSTCLTARGSADHDALLHSERAGDPGPGRETRRPGGGCLRRRHELRGRARARSRQPSARRGTTGQRARGCCRSTDSARPSRMPARIRRPHTSASPARSRSIPTAGRDLALSIGYQIVRGVLGKKTK